MSAFGQAGLTKIPGAVYAVAQDGFATYDKSYSGLTTGGITFLQGDHSTEYPSTVLLSLKITETGDHCQHIRVDLHYEGKDLTFTQPGTDSNINVDFTTSQEPIESHPEFVSQIGGSPTNPLHGAYYDQTTGEFLGFPVIDPDEPQSLPSRFAGVRSYVMPQETYSSNSVEFSYPDSSEIESIGKVITPTIFLPSLPGERNWLNTGIRISNIANVYYRIQRTGQLSGPRKWLEEVYGGGDGDGA